MPTNKKVTRVAKSAKVGQFSTVHSGAKAHGLTITREKASLAERAVREFYSRHGEAMTTLAYE